jgi:class 3 adenylate cyclase/predicted ATPase
MAPAYSEDHSQTRLAAGRRQVTALSYDLVGSTRLAALFDPEDFAELQRSFHGACLKAVGRYGGHVDDIKGDGGLIFFGYPQAHEDDALRAVRAGLDIVSKCERLNEDAKVKGGTVAVRVGIATGIVVVGDFAPGNLLAQSDVIGLPPNLSFKLQKAAEPNCVLISASTHALTGSLFEYVDLGGIAIGGIDAPQHAWRVLRERPFALRFNAIHPDRMTPLVSRDDEIDLITSRWRSAGQGEGQVVLIVGEPGIGKSRLAESAKHGLAVNGEFQVTLQCSAQHANTALYPLISRLDHALELESAHDPFDKIGQLERLLSRAHINSELPLIAYLLEIPTDQRYPPLGLNPDQIKERLHRLFRRVVQRLGGPRPWLIVVEDLQWIDPSSEEMLDLLVERIRQMPGILILTSRPEYAPSWIGQPHVSVVALNRLGPEDSAKIIAHISGPRALSQDTMDTIIDEADGIPLYVEELARGAMQAPAATSLADKDNRRPSAIRIPTTLYDSLTARLDQLGAGKEIAEVGSAIGRKFPLDLASRVAALDEVTAAMNLDKLVEQGIASADREGERIVYTFKHALIQEAAYQSMLRPRRQALHRQIVVLLTSDFAGTRDAEIEVVAHHYIEAGMVNNAITCLLEAGRLAAAKSANAEAERLLKRALKLLQSSPENAERDKTELALLVSLGPVQIATAGPGAVEAQATYRRAIDLCEKLPHDPVHFTAYWGWWRTSPSFKEMHDRANRLSVLADTLADPQFQLQAHHCQWATLFMLGEQQACCVHIARGIQIYDQGDYRLHGTLYGGHDPKVCGLGERGLSMWLLGYPDQALQAAAAGIDHARSLRHAGSIGHAMDQEIMLHRYRKDPITVLDRAGKMRSLGEEQGSKDLLSKSQIFEGWARAALGDPVGGTRLLSDGLTMQRAIGTQEDFPVYFEMLAEAYIALAEYTKALALLDEAIEMADRTGLQYWSAELFRQKGVVEMLQTEAGGERFFDRAVTIAESQSARSLLLRTRICQASLLAKRGSHREAAELLGPAYGTFTEGLDTTDLREASELLERFRQASR